VCERRTALRRGACPLFWTLGGQQVGRGASLGWRDVLRPALKEERRLGLWPFDGPLHELLERYPLVIVETYPAEFYGHLFDERALDRFARAGKRRQEGRAALAPALLAWASRSRVALDDGLVRAIECGFGERASGEDQFDAAIGCFGMLNILLGQRPHSEPTSPECRLVEGWIFGQEASHGDAP
jgi:hypothetical protein